MKTELIQSLTTTFEGHAQQTEMGVEYWLARDLQHLLGYAEWRNFNTSAISKAKTACDVSGHPVADHFVDVNKMVDLGSGSQREVEDIMLTRYACYLIAQNCDPRKSEVAFAQTYFAIQTRRAELIEQRLLDAERVSARKKLSATEKELSDVIFEQTGGNNNFGLIRSKGDQALFGKSNEQRAGHFAGTRHQQPGRPQDPAGTRHSSRVVARSGRCEKGRTTIGFRRKKIAEESGRPRLGRAMSDFVRNAQARALEQTIAANVAGILGV